MRLTPDEVALMVRVRNKIAGENSRDFICIEVMEEIEQVKKEELGRWKNRILFMRRYDICDKWNDRRRRILSAISFGLNMYPTMGEWLHAATRHKDINFPANMRNSTLYTLARIAWLDKIIETGRIQ
jgi:hypothetical protein